MLMPNEAHAIATYPDARKVFADRVDEYTGCRDYVVVRQCGKTKWQGFVRVHDDGRVDPAVFKYKDGADWKPAHRFVHLADGIESAAKTMRYWLKKETTASAAADHSGQERKQSS